MFAAMSTTQAGELNNSSTANNAEKKTDVESNQNVEVSPNDSKTLLGKKINAIPCVTPKDDSDSTRDTRSIPLPVHNPSTISGGTLEVESPTSSRNRRRSRSRSPRQGIFFVYVYTVLEHQIALLQ